MEDLNCGSLVELNRLEDLHDRSQILAKLQVVEQLNCHLVLFDLVQLLDFLVDWFADGDAIARHHFELEGDRLSKGATFGAAEVQGQFGDLAGGNGTIIDLDGHLKFEDFHGLELLVDSDVDRVARQVSQLNGVAHAEEHVLLPGPLSVVAHLNWHHEKLAGVALEFVLGVLEDLGALDLPWLLTATAAAITTLPPAAATVILLVLLELSELLHGLVDLLLVAAKLFHEL